MRLTIFDFLNFLFQSTSKNDYEGNRQQFSIDGNTFGQKLVCCELTLPTVFDKMATL